MRRRNKDRGDDYGMRWEIASALVSGPRSRDEIVEHFRSYLRWVGLFNAEYNLTKGSTGHDMSSAVDQVLVRMIELEWVRQDGDMFSLTALGLQEGEKPLAELRKSAAFIKRLLHPQTVALVTLIVHLVLAAIKLPAGILSGSVGLINDAVDTLLDGVSSLMAYLGLRFGHENAVNVILVFLMIGTGGYGFYQAVVRLFEPVPPSVDWTTFAAVSVSALTCALLWGYQRLVGMKCGNMLLITQSVDSKNHVIVAATVIAGLAASLWDFPVLDTLVGLAVAVLILKSAVELAVELVKARSGGETDLSKYKPGIARRYDDFRNRQMGDWMIYLVQSGQVNTQQELLSYVRETCDFDSLSSLHELGVHKVLDARQHIDSCYRDLLDEGLLSVDPVLAVTPVGEARLEQQKRHVHRDRGRRVAEVLK